MLLSALLTLFSTSFFNSSVSLPSIFESISIPTRALSFEIITFADFTPLIFSTLLAISFDLLDKAELSVVFLVVPLLVALLMLSSLFGVTLPKLSLFVPVLLLLGATSLVFGVIFLLVLFKIGRASCRERV